MTGNFPSWLVPMAATLTEERFTGPEWLFERKFDGIRLIAYKDGDEVTLYSRNRLPQNQTYPAVVDAVRKLPVQNVILDGEAIGMFGPRGKLGYHVFDILWLNDKLITEFPLDERRALLQALPLRAPLERVEALTHDKPWEHACREGWEGVIAKRRDAPYEHRRSKTWLKMKCEETRELVIGGFTDPQGSRVGLGALLVGFFEGKDFVYAGKVGTGLDTRMLIELRARLDQIKTDKPPFTKATGLPRVRANWVMPHLTATVAFTEWTVHGKLRHPRLLSVG